MWGVSDLERPWELQLAFHCLAWEWWSRATFESEAMCGGTRKKKRSESVGRPAIQIIRLVRQMSADYSRTAVEHTGRAS